MASEARTLTLAACMVASCASDPLGGDAAPVDADSTTSDPVTANEPQPPPSPSRATAPWTDPSGSSGNDINGTTTAFGSSDTGEVGSTGEFGDTGTLGDTGPLRDTGALGDPVATTTGDEGDDDELVEMWDEFDDPLASEARWSFRHEVEGEPPQFSDFTFGSAGDDRARIQTTRGGWYGAFKGPYLFQTIDGDFMIEAHVIAHRWGDETLAPEQPYNSAGLLIRNPVEPGAPENWVLHHLGMNDPDGAGVGVERKITLDSTSELELTSNAFRGRIRICRVGDQVVLTRRLDDEDAFSVSAEYELQLEDEVQAGFSLTAWNSQAAEPDLSVEGDVVGLWDYVRYYRISDVAACLDDSL